MYSQSVITAYCVLTCLSMIIKMGGEIMFAGELDCEFNRLLRFLA